jgi:hypothetical protein
MRDPFDGLSGLRRSIRIDESAALPGLKKRLERFDRPEGFYERMLTEDLGHLFPYDRGHQAGFTAQVQSSAPDVEQLIVNALPVYYRPAHSLADGIRHFANDLAQYLVRGPAIIEIELFLDAEGQPARAFDLHIIEQGSVARRGGRLIQFVAPTQSNTWHKGQPYVPLDRDTVVTIDVAAPDRNTLDRAFRVLSQADGQQFVATNMITRPGGSEGFVFDDHRRLVSTRVLSETRSLGWDGRRLFSEGVLEPYWIWRHLQFARFQLGLRTAILTGIQSVIDVAGIALGFEAKLVVSNVLEASDIDHAEQSFIAGTMSLVDLVRLDPSTIHP